MKTIGSGITTLLFSATALAASKPCEELEVEIEIKIQSAGMASYILEIVRNDEVSDPSMVIDSCENGIKKIIYQKSDDWATAFQYGGQRLVWEFE